MHRKGIFFKFFLQGNGKTSTFASYITHAWRVSQTLALVDIQRIGNK